MTNIIIEDALTQLFLAREKTERMRVTLLDAYHLNRDMDLEILHYNIELIKAHLDVAQKLVESTVEDKE